MPLQFLRMTLLKLCVEEKKQHSLSAQNNAGDRERAVKRGIAKCELIQFGKSSRLGGGERGLDFHFWYQHTASPPPPPIVVSNICRTTFLRKVADWEGVKSLECRNYRDLALWGQRGFASLSLLCPSFGGQFSAVSALLQMGVHSFYT